MNTRDLNNLILEREELNNRTLSDLREILEKYPYFQTAHLLFLKNLKLLNNDSLQDQLSLSSVFISDRKRLVYHLTPSTHISVQKDKIADSVKNVAIEEDKKEIPIIKNEAVVVEKDVSKKNVTEVIPQINPIELKKEEPPIKTDEKSLEKSKQLHEAIINDFIKPYTEAKQNGNSKNQENKLGQKTTEQKTDNITSDIFKKIEALKEIKTEKKEEKIIQKEEIKEVEKKKTEPVLEEKQIQPIEVKNTIVESKNVEKQSNVKEVKNTGSKEISAAEKSADLLLKKLEEKKMQIKRDIELKKQNEQNDQLKNKEIKIEQDKVAIENQINEIKKEIQPEVLITSTEIVEQNPIVVEKMVDSKTNENIIENVLTPETPEVLIENKEIIKEEQVIVSTVEENIQEISTEKKEFSSESKNEPPIELVKEEIIELTKEEVKEVAKEEVSELVKLELVPQNNTEQNITEIDKLASKTDTDSNKELSNAAEKLFKRISAKLDKQPETKEEKLAFDNNHPDKQLSAADKLLQRIADRKNKLNPQPEVSNPVRNTDENSNSNLQHPLIEKFIETEPKIERKKEVVTTNDLSENSTSYSDTFMTETMADIYVKQGNYIKAKEVFEKLILKYPEKNSYFAGRIVEIEKILNTQ